MKNAIILCDMRNKRHYDLTSELADAFKRGDTKELCYRVCDFITDGRAFQKETCVVDEGGWVIGTYDDPTTYRQDVRHLWRLVSLPRDVYDRITSGAVVRADDVALAKAKVFVDMAGTYAHYAIEPLLQVLPAKTIGWLADEVAQCDSVDVTIIGDATVTYGTAYDIAEQVEEAMAYTDNELVAWAIAAIREEWQSDGEEVDMAEVVRNPAEVIEYLPRTKRDDGLTDLDGETCFELGSETWYLAAHVVDEWADIDMALPLLYWIIKRQPYPHGAQWPSDAVVAEEVRAIMSRDYYLSAGIPGLTYTSELRAFVEAHRLDVMRLFREVSEDLGETYTADDMLDVMSGDYTKIAHVVIDSVLCRMADVVEDIDPDQIAD